MLQVLSVVGLLQDETDPMVSVMKVLHNPGLLLYQLCKCATLLCVICIDLQNCILTVSVKLVLFRSRKLPSSHMLMWEVLSNK